MPVLSRTDAVGWAVAAVARALRARAGAVLDPFPRAPVRGAPGPPFSSFRLTHTSSVTSCHQGHSPGLASAGAALTPAGNAARLAPLTCLTLRTAMNVPGKMDRKRRPRSLARIVTGWAMLVLGVIGWILPIMPGWLFIGIGALLLAPHIRFFRRMAACIHLRFPSLRAGLRRFRRH